MTPFHPVRTALFVPGNRPDRADKAVQTRADAVILDLEDAVPPAQKADARPLIRDKIDAYPDRPIWVRINALDSGWAEADLEQVLAPGLGCIIVPKVENARHVHEICRLLTDLERQKGLPSGTVRVIPLIESAAAVENAYAVAATDTTPVRLTTLAFGAADFALDMGITLDKSGDALAFPRARIAIACRAAGVAPPLDTPFMIDLKDREALEADARRAVRFGFQGKLCIHPNQVDVCNHLFSPTPEAIAFARRVVQAFEEAEAGGSAALQVDGKFIDYPVVEHSRRILRLAAAIDG